MAVNVLIPLLIPLEEDIHNATKLLSGVPQGPVSFNNTHYAASLPEDADLGTSVTQVLATHNQGLNVRYSITEGNQDGVFTIDQHSGLISLAAHLDYERHIRHELLVAAEAEGSMAYSRVLVEVGDVNDNPPVFVKDAVTVTVIEEDDRDLPKIIAMMNAEDVDVVDRGRLVYSISGDGIDGMHPYDAFFTINTSTGDVVQLRALDRDPPKGKPLWRVVVRVRDGPKEDPYLSEGDYTVLPSVGEAPLNTRSPRGVRNTQGPDVQGMKGRTRDLAKEEGSSFVVKNDPSLGFVESFRMPSDKGSNEYWEFVSGFNESYSKGRVGYHPYHRIRRRRIRQKSKRSVGENSEVDSETILESARKDSLYHGIRKRIRKRRSRGANEPSRNLPLPESSMRMCCVEGKPCCSGEERSLPKRTQPQERRNEGTNVKSPVTQARRKNVLSKSHPSSSPSSSSSSSLSSSSSSPSDETSQKVKSGVPSLDQKIPYLTHETPKASLDHIYDSHIPQNVRLVPSTDSQNPLVSPRLSPPLHLPHHPSSSPSTEIPPLHYLPPSSPPSSTYGESQFVHVPPRQMEHRGETNSNPALGKGTHFSDASGLRLEGSSLLPHLPTNRLPQGNQVHVKEAGASLAPEVVKTSLEPSSTLKSSPSLASKRVRNARYVTEKQKLPMSVIDGPGDSFALHDDASYMDSVYGDDGVMTALMEGDDYDNGLVHETEAIVKVVVKDINDNAPVFPNATMHGEAQENGPIDLDVAKVEAWDADDSQEGTNARLSYSIEKNVIDERSGAAIFSVNPTTGLIRTALCCLDRETTPEYYIQVVATDGGGLKGTGTVVVHLSDVNDNPPRLSRNEWVLVVNETVGDGPPDPTPILEITTRDPDISNYFFYRVVNASGWGWEHFGIRTNNTFGELYALKTLDYEDATHRRGFKFKVQVTDRGRGGWDDLRHIDSAYVQIKLRDVNDHPPVFERPHASVSIREDAEAGTLLASMPASDPDLGGNQKVEYYLEDEWNSLQVDDEGNVRVWRQLDREGMIGGVGRVKVIGVDQGDPPLSSTATLTVTLTDVNDTPPRLLPPTTFQVEEGSPPTRLGVLTATDDDVWALGHGPPFNFTLAPSNPSYIYDYIQLRLDPPDLDAGRGGAELWTTAPIDREEHRVLIVEVTVADAGKLAETYPISVVVRDINDNPMKPGSKTVYLWKTQSGGSEVSMGRVFVEDPDDWDIGDKTFHWLGPPHQLFALDTNTGIIYANSHIREGSYDLQFSVSDRVWNQSNVRANVTVVVRVLPPDALTHAVPLMLTPTTPKHLTQKWNPMSGGGGLGALVRGIKKALKDMAESVHVVSVYEDDQWKGLISNISSKTELLRDGLASEDMVVARVWISVRQESGSFMDPVKLEGLLAMHAQELEDATELIVVAGNGVDNVLQERKGKEEDPVAGGTTPWGRQALASTSPALQVVDTNSTSIVTPRLFRRQVCPSNVAVLEPEACTPTTCLNGGRCVRSDLSYRCICPFGTWGSRCKVVSRTFTGIGWAWVHPVPLCLPTTVSFQLLTRRPEALLLYLGPLAPTGRKIIQGPAPMLSLELRKGRPQFLLEGPGGPLQMTVNTTRPLHDGSWHTLHLHFDNKGVSLMVDYCAGRDGEMVEEAHCIAKTSWKRPITSKAWVGSEPLQVGGMAHAVPRPEQHDWTHGPSAKPLTGCIRRLSINGVLVDLGSPAHSHGSFQGCALQDEACPSGCGFHGLCDGGLHSPICNCDPGWAGTDCRFPTVPASLGNGSYVKMALSFTPGPYTASMQIRLRTRQRQGDILQLSSEHQASSFTLTLENGLACVIVQGGEHRTKQRLCLTSRPVNDGVWHFLRAERYGANLLISMDDGDSWRRNATIHTLVTVKEKLSLRSRKKTPELLKLLNVDKQEGVHIGGTPEFLGVSVLKVHRDLENSCIDDVRIDDRPLPIPPAENGTQWGQVTMWENVQKDCQAADACGNLTCGPPFICRDIWKQAVCGCGPGKELVGGKCQDVDECIYRPCLYSGTCINRRPMYSCSCTPGHAGNNCQWPIDVNSLMYVTTPAVFTAIMLFLLILLLAGGLLFYRNRRQRAGGTGNRNGEGQDGSDGDDAGSSRTGKEVDRDTGKEIQSIEMDHDKIWLAVNPELPNGRPAIISQTGQSSKKKAAEVASKKTREGGGGGGEAPRGGPPGVVGAMTEKGGTVVPVMARDDLRAYAYEGDGSSSGSLSSALSGLRVDLTDDGEISKLAPSFREVVDLLRHLPDTFDSTKTTNSTSTTTTSNNSKSTSNNSKSTSNNSTLRRPKQEISTVC